MSVFGIGDSQRGRWRVAVAPVNGCSDAINVQSQPEHGVRLIELNVFRQDSALFPRDVYTEMQIVREVRLVWQAVVKKFECGVTQCALRLWRAVVWHGSCANILSRFRPGPGNHDGPPRYDMISEDLFFLALTLHRLTLSDDLTAIYHNIRCVHRLRGAEGVSDGKPVKQATNHPKTRQKRAGSVFTACMSMRASA